MRAAPFPERRPIRGEEMHELPTDRSRLRSAEHALHIISLALSDDGTTGTVLLIDRLPPAQGIAVPIDDDPDGRTADRVDELVLQAVDPEPGCRIVLAVRRRAGLSMVDESDVELWRRLPSRHKAAGIPLVDLFILSGQAAFSMAELVGPPADWAAA
jgi:hypothetical protein